LTSRERYVTSPSRGGAASEDSCRAARRRLSVAEAPDPSAATGIFTLGELRVDFGKRQVELAGSEVHLTPTEYKLLGVLVARLGRAVSHNELLREVWGPEFAEQVEYLRTFMRQLRYSSNPSPLSRATS